MLAKRIIPCLDVKDGRVVKGVSFVNLRDAGDPVENAKFYDEQGADELIFLDITASHEKRDIILDVVEKTANDVFMPLTVGGGIKSLDDIRDLLRAGCDKVSVNTAAVNDPGFVKQAAERFGSQCIVVAIDAKKVSSQQSAVSSQSIMPEWLRSSPALQKSLFLCTELQTLNSGLLQWEVYTHGGRNPKGIDAVEWAKYVQELGAGEIMLTSMDNDGTKNGYDIELTRTVSEAVSIPVIASGGAGTLEHLYEGLVYGKADAVLAASIFHFREYTISEAKKYLESKGVLVRL